MNLERKTMTLSVGGKEISFETGKIARQAHGAVLVKCGETLVFSTACMAPEAQEGIDFLPLKVDYQEKFSSAGKTLSGFIKREGRPTQRETLISRLIDRPLRPMFEDGLHNEIQVLSYVWSYDGMNSPEPLAICACSAALAISEIPLIKPVAAVRVGYVNGQFVINPTVEEQKNSKLDLLMAGTHDAVLMIEGFSDFLTEEQVIEALETGHAAISKIADGIAAWAKKIGKEKKRTTIQKLPEATFKAVESLAAPLLKEAVRIKEKTKRETAFAEAKEKVFNSLLVDGEEKDHSRFNIEKAYKEVSSKIMRKMILEENVRSDGRDTKTVRPIDVEQALLPRAHGSSLFTRGETQTLAVCTLGGEKHGSALREYRCRRY